MSVAHGPSRLGVARGLVATSWRAGRALFVGATLAEALFAVSAPVLARAIGALVDSLTGPGPDRAGAIVAAATIGVSAAAMWVCGGLGGRLRTTLMEKTGFSYERQLVRSALSVRGIGHLQDQRLADQAFLARDYVGATGAAANAILNAGAAFTRTTVTVALLALADPVWLAVVGAAIPMALATSRAARIGRDADIEAARPRRQARDLTDACLGADAVALLRTRGRDANVRARVMELLDEDWRIRRRAVVRGLKWRIGAMLLFASTFAVVGSWSVRSSGLSPGEAVALVVLGVQLSGFLYGLNQSWGAAAGSLRPVEHVQAYIATLEDRRESGGGVPLGVPSSDDPVNAVEFKDVKHSYGDVTAIDGITISLRAGEAVGIVGENGAGKSTFVSLLLGLLDPTEGLITRATSEDCHSALLQDFCRPEFVVLDAVGFGADREPWTEADVARAVAETPASDVIRRLDAGLHSQLGGSWGGADLSGGEWQMIAFSRSGMRSSPTVVALDEPSSAIAPDVEHAMLEALRLRIRRLTSEGAPVVVVSHRLGLMTSVDRVVVLDGGRIIEEGTHHQLMQVEGGHYRALFTAQAAGYR